MASWDTHRILVVAPPQDVQRLVQKFAVTAGDAASSDTDEAASDRNGTPSVHFGPGQYYATKCAVGIADLEIEFEAVVL